MSYVWAIKMQNNISQRIKTYSSTFLKCNLTNYSNIHVWTLFVIIVEHFADGQNGFKMYEIYVLYREKCRLDSKSKCQKRQSHKVGLFSHSEGWVLLFERMHLSDRR